MQVKPRYSTLNAPESSVLPPYFIRLGRGLTRDLLAHNYDLELLISGLVSSRAYARSSEWKGKEPGKELFAVAIVRPLTPAQWGLSQRLVSEPTAWNATDPAVLRLKALDGQEARRRKSSAA